MTFSTQDRTAYTITLPLIMNQELPQEPRKMNVLIVSHL